MARGGKRPGAGRPTVAKQLDGLNKRLAAKTSRLDVLRRLLNAYEMLMTREMARGRNANKRHLIDIGAGIRGAIELMGQLESGSTDPEKPKAIVRAPEICETTAEWVARYGTEAPKPKPEPAPAIAELEKWARAATDPIPSPFPRLAVDNDAPPVRVSLPDAPPTEIPMAFWADHSRRRRTN